MLEEPHHNYKNTELICAIKTILSTTHPLTRRDISKNLDRRVTSRRISKLLNALIDDGEVLKFSGHPDTFLRATEDKSIYFSNRGKPRVRS